MISDGAAAPYESPYLSRNANSRVQRTDTELGPEQPVLEVETGPEFRVSRGSVLPQRQTIECLTLSGQYMARGDSELIEIHHKNVPQ